MDIANVSMLNYSDSHNCTFEFYDNPHIKFALLAVASPIFCAFGIFGNLLAAYIFTRPTMRNSSNWYLVFIALSDLGVIVTYVLLYSVEIIYDHLRLVELYHFWFSYARPLYWISNVFQICGMYLTVAATIESYVGLRFPRLAKRFCTSKGTAITSLFVLSGTVAITSPKYWEMEVVYQPECSGFGRFLLIQSELSLDVTYALVYSMWISNVAFCFLPFLILVVMNLLILWKIRHSYEVQTGSDKKRKRKETRQATLILVVVVFVFLVCNTPSVVMSIVENVDIDFLLERRDFYNFGRDFINMLAVLEASASFVIYLVFGKEFRDLSRHQLCANCANSRPTDYVGLKLADFSMENSLLLIS